MERVLLAVVVLVALGGCTGLASDIGGPFEGGETVEDVTVVHVVDGDTVDVRFQDGSTERVRLLGIDTPEVHGTNSPAEFEGVPDTEAGEACLREVGQDASEYTTERLQNRTVRIVFDEAADRRGGYGRLLAYVYLNDSNVNHDLVAEGYARVYDTTFTQADRFYEAEDRARTEEMGVWQCVDASS